MAAARAHAQALLDCMISSWYPNFSDVTFRTVLVPLPREFLDWVVADGVYLPEDSEALARRGPQDPLATEDDYQDWESSDSGSGSGSGSTAAPRAPQPQFPELLAEVRRGIEDLGGAVLPKLSWSCPKDAVWLTADQTARCRNPGEVLLLLKSSDRVAHDVDHAFDDCRGEEGGAPAAEAGAVPHVLALRKWYDLRPDREFRCFVAGQRLIGVSQRDVTQRFPALAEELPALRAAVCAFHTDRMVGRFPQDDYTYDVYVATTGAVKLVDFNPAGEGTTTAPLLFTWDELEDLGRGAGARAGPGATAAEQASHENGVGGEAQGSEGRNGGGGEEEEEVDFRVVLEPVALRPHKLAYGVPFDFADTSEGSALSQLAAAQAQLGLGDEGGV